MLRVPESIFFWGFPFSPRNVSSFRLWVYSPFDENSLDLLVSESFSSSFSALCRQAGTVLADLHPPPPFKRHPPHLIVLFFFFPLRFDFELPRLVRCPELEHFPLPIFFAEFLRPFRGNPPFLRVLSPF